MLEAAVAAGVAAAGGEALLGGILPTPGAPLLIERHGFDLGVVLSASHNPYQDNGIKFFGGDGYKLSDADRGRDRGRARAAARRARASRAACARSTARSRTTCARSQERFDDLDLTGQRILLDCANGATFRAAPEIFRRLGADIGDHRPRARRPQHQPQLRLHAPRPAAGRDADRRRRGRLRLRRRRRPHARRGPQRRRRRRRRADRARRASTCASRAACPATASP